jgi:hypothetical protein
MPLTTDCANPKFSVLFSYDINDKGWDNDPRIFPKGRGSPKHLSILEGFIPPRDFGTARLRDRLRLRQ